MEWSILFMGPVGAGKSAAIRTLSDIDAADTDVRATDETADLKEFTTVSMDAGVLDLGGGDKVRLLGAPGQDRFDFMWDILLEQANAVVLMVNHNSHERLNELDHYLQQLAQRLMGRRVPLAIGVSHVDKKPSLSLDIYRDHLAIRPVHFAKGVIPVFPVDARQLDDVRALVISVAAMLEMEQRFGREHH